MENFLKPIYQEYTSDLNTLGVLIMEKTKQNSPLTDNFDIILLIIVRQAQQNWKVNHYETAEDTVAQHIVTEELLTEWIDTSGYRRAIEWIIYGKAIFDRGEFIRNLKGQLRDFPYAKRDLRKAIEFGKLINSYTEAKYLFESNHYKDANSKILYSLHYIARLAIIEKGYYPEITVWSQVKQIDLEIYKLYEEFIQSNEEIGKRIQLMIIAMEHVINKRAKVAVKHLLDIMQMKETPWSYSQLKVLPALRPYRSDLPSIISYLEQKDIIDVAQEKISSAIYQRKYMVKE